MSGLVFAMLLVGGAFFLTTRPSADVPQSAIASSAPTQPAPSSAAQPTLGLPQPDQSQSVERAVILDHPLATSKSQDGSAGSATNPAPLPSAAPKPDSFSTRILNGSGQSGLATSTQTKLTQQGFHITDVGTAMNQYTTSVIYYTVGHDAQAKLVQSAFGQADTQLQADDVARPADVLLVIGASAAH